MSLIKCSECGNEVSEYADKCPNCGCPVGVIKSISNTNNYIIVFKDGESINLEGIEEQIQEDQLNNTDKLWDILNNKYSARVYMCSVIGDIFKFNNYKFPTNYQEAYESMCAHNRARNQARTNALPKCPYCHSTNLKKIGVGGRLLSVGTLGIAGSKIGKQWHCNNCKSDF